MGQVLAVLAVAVLVTMLKLLVEMGEPGVPMSTAAVAQAAPQMVAQVWLGQAVTLVQEMVAEVEEVRTVARQELGPQVVRLEAEAEAARLVHP